MYKIIKKLKDKLVENNYSYNIYPKILMRIIRINEMGFNDISIDEFIIIMKENILKINEKIVFDRHGIIAQDQKELDIYNKKNEIF